MVLYGTFFDKYRNIGGTNNKTTKKKIHKKKFKNKPRETSLPSSLLCLIILLNPFAFLMLYSAGHNLLGWALVSLPSQAIPWKSWLKPRCQREEKCSPRAICSWGLGSTIVASVLQCLHLTKVGLINRICVGAGSSAPANRAVCPGVDPKWEDQSIAVVERWWESQFVFNCCQ